MKKKIEVLIFLAFLVIFVFVGHIKLAALYYNRGTQYHNRGQYAKALGYFRKSLKIKPDIAKVHFALANTYIANGELNRAKEEYVKTIRLDALFARAYKSLAQAYLNQGMYEEAIDLLKQAHEKIPSDKEFKQLLDNALFEYSCNYLYRAVDAFEKQNKKQAYSLLSQALMIEPDFTYSHYTLAYFYYADHNLDAAEKQLNKALEIDSSYWPAYKLLGDIYFEKGDYETAITNYESALTRNYKDASLHNSIGLALMQTEQYEEAGKHLKEASVLSPGDMNIRYSLASVFRDAGQNEQAIAGYMNIIKSVPDYPNVHNNLGDIFRLQKKKTEARQEYLKEIEYSSRRLLEDPNNVFTLNCLAYAYNATGDYNRAREAVKKALGIDPNYREAYLTLSSIEEKLNNYKAAASLLAKADSLSGQQEFIKKDISRINNLMKISVEQRPLDKIYLKNGRYFEGIIKEETADKIILEIYIGNTTGLIYLYKDTILKIKRPD